jgi:hypothetical protein
MNAHPVNLEQSLLRGGHRKKQRPRLVRQRQETMMAIERCGLIVLGINQKRKGGWRRKQDATKGIGEQGRAKPPPAKPYVHG